MSRNRLFDIGVNACDAGGEMLDSFRSNTDGLLGEACNHHSRFYLPARLAEGIGRSFSSKEEVRLSEMLIGTGGHLNRTGLKPTCQTRKLWYDVSATLQVQI